MSDILKVPWLLGDQSCEIKKLCYWDEALLFAYAPQNGFVADAFILGNYSSFGRQSTKIKPQTKYQIPKPNTVTCDIQADKTG
jgi:hypothetical protein